MRKRDLMSALGEAARRERTDDDEFEALFDALQRGELTEAQRAALARRDDREQLEELARPLGDSFRRGLGERLAQELAVEQVAATDEKVVAFAKRPALTRYFVPLAAAATVLLAVGLYMTLPSAPSGALPGYSLSLAGAVTELRGGNAPVERAEFVDGNFFDLQLTPDTAVATDLDLAVRLYVVGPGASPVALVPQPAVQVTGKGVVIVEGEIGDDVRLPPGDSTVIVVLGSAAALPDAAEIERLLEASAALQARGWRGWEIPVRKR